MSERREMGLGGREQTVCEHPSYVSVSFSRRSGNPRLFGSPLDQHYGYVTLSVAKARLIRDDTDDRIDAGISGDILEVDLSESQFASLLTTMNTAGGTPGTMRRFMNSRIEEPPQLPSRIENIKSEFARTMRDLSLDIVQKHLPRAKELLLGKPSLNKSERVEIWEMLQRIYNKLSEHAPFIVEMLNEAANQRVAAGRAEIDGIVARTLASLGRKVLEDNSRQLLTGGWGEDK